MGNDLEKHLIVRFLPSGVDNIYQLDGKVPVGKAIPFGLQHVLAMFVANIAPIMIVTGTCGLSSQETASLIQVAMLMAGVGTLVQLFTVWKLGAKLPIVMGISFTFVSIGNQGLTIWAAFSIRSTMSYMLVTVPTASFSFRP